MMAQALSVVGGARVVLYSPIDNRHRPTGGCKQIVAGVLQGPAAGLAICQYEGEDAYYLFGCDDRWNSVTDSWHEMVQGAMQQAEFEYAGIWRTWLNHEPAWEPLPDADERAVWDLFNEQFGFRTGIGPGQWPGIREPTPSITYDTSAAFSGQDATAVADPNAGLFPAFKACVPPGGRLYALDWQHACYTFNPFGRFEFSAIYEGMIPVVPDGDYSIFLADDLSFGTFGHPWEQTVCFFGQPMLAAIERDRPKALDRVVRRHGAAVW